MAGTVGYEGKILWDTEKPNGTPRKLLDVSKATALGWSARTELRDGVRMAYEDFLTNTMRAERSDKDLEGSRIPGWDLAVAWARFSRSC